MIRHDLNGTCKYCVESPEVPISEPELPEEARLLRELGQNHEKALGTVNNGKAKQGLPAYLA